jgi:3-hydroxyacyl-[acyl-carrier-protein] dehydratase
MSKDIESLLPHRYPFLFADEVLSATREEIKAVKTFSPDDQFLRGSFQSRNFVPGTILIESMAQCGGAGVKLLNISEGLFGLVSIDDAEMLQGAEYNKPVTYIIRNLRLTENMIKQSGIAYVDDVPVARATWMCVKMAS